MTRIGICAFAALALCGCGGLDESAVPVGTGIQAIVSEEPPPPVEEGPQRLSVEELFRDTSPTLRSPEDRTLADKEHYVVEVKPPPCH